VRHGSLFCFRNMKIQVTKKIRVQNYHISYVVTDHRELRDGSVALRHDSVPPQLRDGSGARRHDTVARRLASVARRADPARSGRCVERNGATGITGERSPRGDS